MDDDAGKLPLPVAVKRSYSECSSSSGEAEDRSLATNKTLLAQALPAADDDGDGDDNEEGGNDGDDDEMVRESLSLDVVWRGSERYPLRIPKYATILS
ncbi:hypothetical protein GGI21_003814, partial [Coemansia aciculifera]